MYLCTVESEQAVDALSVEGSGGLLIAYHAAATRLLPLHVLAFGHQGVVVDHGGPMDFSAHYSRAEALNGFRAFDGPVTVDLPRYDGVLSLSTGSTIVALTPLRMKHAAQPDYAATVLKLLGASRIAHGRPVFYFEDGMLVVQAAKTYRLPASLLSAQRWFDLLSRKD